MKSVVALVPKWQALMSWFKIHASSIGVWLLPLLLMAWHLPFYTTSCSMIPRIGGAASLGRHQLNRLAYFSHDTRKFGWISPNSLTIISSSSFTYSTFLLLFFANCTSLCFKNWWITLILIKALESIDASGFIIAWFWFCCGSLVLVRFDEFHWSVWWYERKKRFGSRCTCHLHSCHDIVMMDQGSHHWNHPCAYARGAIGAT